MSDDESDSQSTTSKGKPTKVNFVLLKQILEDDSSDSLDQEEQTVKNKDDQSKKDDPKPEQDTTSCRPLGRYPILFSKRCKSKSCQTKLSAFPLFSVPEDTEWLSEDEEVPKRKRVVEKRLRRRRNSSESRSEKNKVEEITEKAPEKTKNADGTRKSFNSEHQLKETKNPIIQAWLQRKNKLTRKNRREERREKKAQRAALEEEERLKSERFEESEKRVKEWFKIKRKEARKIWKQNHPKVSPFEMAFGAQTEILPPSPEYKVVKTFQQKHTRYESFTTSNSLKVERQETVSAMAAEISSISDKNIHLTKNKRTKNLGYSKSLDEQNTFESPKGLDRPKTAHSFAHSKKNKTHTRPKTAKSANTTQEITNSKDLNDSARQMKLGYDEWLKSKRAEDKKKVIDRRRELIDSHLDSVIAKLGKQRVEKIRSSKKQIDTGLKNVSRSGSKSPSAPKAQSYKWKNSHDMPRPEPQGCDCNKTEYLDTESVITHRVKDIPLSPSSQRKKADEFCEEVTQKCDQLKPSMDRVLDILDSEMKKCLSPDKEASKKAPSVLSSTNATCNDNIDVDLLLPGTVGVCKPQVQPKSTRPASARPKPKLVANTNLTIDEAKKKIFHDMDVLGLCHSDENLNNKVAKENEDNYGNTVAKGTDENFGNIVAKETDDTCNHGNTFAKEPIESDIPDEKISTLTELGS